MVHKKLSARIISFLSVLAMVFTLMPNGLTAYAADIEDCIDYTITTSGIDPDGDGVVKNGDEFRVLLECFISSEYTDTTLPLDITFKIDTSSVKLSGSGNVMFGNAKMGTYSFDEDGTVRITIDDNSVGRAFIEQGDRSFSVNFSGSISVEETEDGSSVEETIKVGEEEITVTVEFPDSTLSHKKEAVGDAWYDPDTGEVYQTYIITLTAENGNVRDIDVYDYLGKWLSGPMYYDKDADYYYDETVKITYDANELFGKSREDYIYDIDIANDNSNFSFHIDEIRRGETVEIEYTLVVDMEYFSGDDDNDSRSINKYGVGFTDQNGNVTKPEPTGWVSPEIERPGVTKGGEYTVNGDEVVWTIVVDAGIFESCDDFIDEFGIVVTDTPGDGLAEAGKKIVLPEYENNYDGTYTFTYTTKLTDDVIEQLKDLSQTVTVHNDVEAGNNDFKFTASADATRDGIGILDKKATANEPDADGRFAWQSTLTVPAEGIHGLVFTDSTASSDNGHTIIKNTMKIDGTSVTELEKAGKITVTVSGKRLVISFSDAYLAELQAKNKRAVDDNGTVYVTDIDITYMTEADDASELDASYIYTNQSDIEYTITESGDKVTGTDSDKYIQTITPKKYISKSQRYSNGDWEIVLDVMLDELEVGDVFKITDTPENMAIIEDSITPYVYFGSWDPHKVSEFCGDVDSFLTFLDNDDGTYTFTFKVTQELYDAINGALTWQSPSSVYFSIVYSTRVTNPDELAEAAWSGLEYTNTADGTFNGLPTEQVVATKYFYNQEPVSKKFLYSKDNTQFEYGESNGKVNARFEVTINPASIYYGEEDYIYLTDKMSGGLKMIPASTVLEDTLTGKTLKNGVDYFINFDVDNNEMYFTVPNGKSLKLTYMAEIDGEAPATPDAYVPFDVENTIELYSKNGASFASSAGDSGSISSSSATATASGYSITISKTSEINGTKLFPIGAKFEVVRVSYNALTGEFKEYDDNQQGANITIVPIEDSNLTLIMGLEPDAIYRLREIEPPEGYKLATDPIYFMNPTNETNPNPAVIGEVKNMEVCYFNNDPDFGSLEITKTVDAENITDAELRGALKFTVQNEEGKYVDENGELHDEKVEITLSSFKKQRNGTFVLTFTQLPSGKYTVTETNTDIEGYKLVSTSTTHGDVTVEAGENAKIELRDIYEEVGNLKITKSVDGLNVTDEEKAGALKFTVQNKDGKYLDEDGNLHDEKVEITLDKFTKQDDGTYVLELNDVALGEYTVTETNTEIEGYKFISEESTTSDTAEVKQGKTATIELNDCYVESGNLKITKSVDGLNVTDEEKAGALKFTVQNKDGKYLDANGNLHDEKVEITLDKFTKQDDGTYVLEFEDVATGEYKVTETNTTIDGYKLISEESTTSGTTEVKQSETATIELKDSYEAIGSLKITKSVDGLNVTDEEKAGALKFTVQNKDGKYLDANGNLHDEKVEITLDKFTKQDDGTYVLKFEGIATGEYKVTETNTEIDGYKLVSDASVTSGTDNVTKGKLAEIELKDSYVEIGNLKITKSVDGLNVTDEEKAGALKFTVQNKDGKYLDANGNLHDEKVEITLDKFTKQDDGTYVLEFEGIATGEYKVTETNTTIDGYKLISEESTTSGTTEVKQSETATIELKDSYEEIGNLKITKSVDGLNVTDEEKAGALKFTVQNKDGKYLDAKGNLHDKKVEITLDKFTKQDDGTYVLEFEGIATGEYKVTETNTEIDGYKFISEESTTSGTAEVKQSKTATIELKDSYEEIGNLKITKTVDADNITDAELNGALKFTVQNKDGKYLDAKGNLHDEKVEITLDKFTKQDDGTYVLEFEGIATGEYKVTETNTEIDGYRLISEESTTSGTAEVKQSETATIELKDIYEEIGNLKITKTVDADNITDAELNGALKFTVQNEDGKYLDAKGNLHDEKIEITLDKFTKQDDGTYVLEFEGVATGKYTVTETDTEIDGYEFTSSESVTEGKAEVTKGKTAVVDLKDIYEEIGNLKITKTVDADNITDAELNGALKFTVQNEDGKYLDEDGNLHDEKVEITLDKFTKQDDGTYVLEFEGVATGKYTVTETDTEIDGYEFVSSESVTEGEAEVTKGKTAEIDLKDIYEEIGNLKITKSIDGLNITDEEKAGALKFTVQNEDGKYLDENGNLHDEKVEITLDKFTKQDDGTYVLEFKDITAGKYIVTETNTDIAGYKLISDASVTSGENKVTKGETADIYLKDSYYKTTSVTINKKDIANDEEVEGAKLEIFDKDGNKIGEWTSEKGKTHTIDGLKPGEKYTLRETITPDGYETATDIVFMVDEDGNVTVVSGKDGSVDKDGVLIVNDTKKTEDNDSKVNGDEDGDDRNPQTGYDKTDVIPTILLTGAALVAVTVKKRRED